MTSLLSADELQGMLPVSAILPTLPDSEDGSLDEARILEALKVATGMIVTHLPWLLDDETGEIALPLPAQFEDTLRGVCCDIALIRLTDAVTSKDDDKSRYRDSFALLKTIAAEHQGGLMGPDYQSAEIVVPSEEEGIPDDRFFKKGGLI